MSVCVRRAARMVAMVEEVALATGVPAHEVNGPFRNRRAVRARQWAFWRARTELGQSFPEIGRFFKRDHSTVMHGVQRHEARAQG